MASCESQQQSAPRDDRHRFARRWLFVVATIFMIAMLAWIVYSNRPLLESIWQRGPRWTPLAIAVFLLIVESINLACRWNALLRAAGIVLPLRSVYRMTASSIIASAVAPGANGGDALKLACVLAVTPNRTSAVATIIADRLAGVIGLFLVGLIAGGLAWSQANTAIQVMTVFSGLFVVAGLIGISLVDSRFFRSLVSWIGTFHPRLAPIVTQLQTTASELRNHPSAMIQALGLAVFGHCLNIAAFYFMSQALHVTTSAPWLYLVIVPFIFLSTAIPLPFGAFGVTEGISDQLFRMVAVEGGGVAMLGYRFAYLISMPLLALIMLVLGGAPTAPPQDTTSIDEADSQ